jgi:hypothetical protein
MKKPGFPPTTIALVVIMFGALFMVSKMVTPPPAAPPPVTPASATETTAPKGDPGHGEPGHVHGKGEGETPDAAKPDPKQAKEQMDKMRKAYEQKMKDDEKKRQEEAKIQAEAKARMSKIEDPAVKPSKYDPNSTNIDSKFFNEMPMGDQGIQETDQEVAKAEVLKAKMQKIEAAVRAEKSGKPKSEQPKQATP